MRDLSVGSARATVARHHDNLNARFLHLRDRFARLGAHVIADGRKADEDDILVDLALLKGLRRIPERQHAHRTRCIGVYFFVERIRIESRKLSLRAERIFCAREERFGRALVDHNTTRGQLRLAEFIRRVKGLALPCAAVFIRLHCAVVLRSQKAHDRLIGRVASDNAARLVIHGGTVRADRRLQLPI